MTELKISRRSVIAGMAAAGMLFLGGCLCNCGQHADGLDTGKKRVLRFAHFADMHFKPDDRAIEGLTKALRHAQDVSGAELLITGGDNIGDSTRASYAWAVEQWQALGEVFKEECAVPVMHCIGNHDIWGLSKESSKTTGDEPLWGKKLAMQELNLARPYYSFEMNGWRFLVLDSLLVEGNLTGHLVGQLDDEQLKWLTDELAASNLPTVVVSHMPVITVAAYEHREREDYNVLTKAKFAHYDGPELVKLFGKSGRVKLCLSGHTHVPDRIEYKNITYICDGPVCGNLWRSATGGYGLIDLYDDGTFEYEYVRLNGQQAAAK